jgi:glycosyltransferase involved in cell wall biosynthesis
MCGVMIKVVYCLDTLQIGGTELNAVRTAERLDRSRFDLRVVHLHQDGPLLARYHALGVPLRHLPITSLLGARTAAQGVSLAGYLRRERVDIFHSHDIYCNIFGVPWARLAGVPAVVASRRWWDASPRPSQQAANRLAYRFAHQVLANSPSVARLVEEEGVSRRRVKSIPNFVDDAAFAALPHDERLAGRRELGVPDDGLAVGVVARLVPVKDHATLIRAAALLAADYPRLHLVLVGDGDTRPALEALAAELLPADRVHFTGTRGNDVNLHQLFDVSVLSSLSEGFPNSVVEAMAASRPVVATSVGGTADAVIDGETGFLVPPRDPAAMAAGLRRLLDDEQLRRTMGRAGSDRARREYHAASVIGTLSTWYESLVA